jgi:phage-related protein
VRRLSFTIRFYKDNRDREVVKNWIMDQPPKVRAAIASDLDILEKEGISIGMPLVRPLKQGLYELRTEVDRNAYRIFFIVEGDCFLLHSFQKVTRKTPSREMEIARKRQKKLLNEIRIKRKRR